MIREIGATVAGLASAVVVFFLVASSPSSSSATQTSDGLYNPTRIAFNMSGEAQMFYYPGTIGSSTGIGPVLSLILVLMAVLIGGFVSWLVPRVARRGEVS